MRRRDRGPEFPEWLTSPLVSDYLTADEVTDPVWQVTAWQRHVKRLDAWGREHRVPQEDVPVRIPRLVAQ